MSDTDRIVLNPIGFVKTEAIGNEVRDRSNISKIILHEDLAETIEGIEGFSHLFILFWMHRISVNDRKTMRVHPRGRRDIPLIGIYATRTPYRRNPIGLTLVELLEVRGHVLTVRGLDAFDGTPVLDIKPSDPWDAVEDMRVPEWWMGLEKRSKEKRSI